ncbi:MAG: nucleotide exchange factor GrpE [Anaerolineae bacterium]
MGRRVSIPVRVIRSTESPAGAGDVHEATDRSAALEGQQVLSVESREPAMREPDPEPVEQDTPCADLDEWRDRALRLQADMENYRKRQQRTAQEQTVRERNRLLNEFLKIVDDLERALVSSDGDRGPRNDQSLRRGVELTHRAAMQLLEKEGATAIAAEGQLFDPKWHEAVATVPRNGGEVEPGTIVRVMEPGYRIDDQLLRPAKVVVAV